MIPSEQYHKPGVQGADSSVTPGHRVQFSPSTTHKYLPHYQLLFQLPDAMMGGESSLKAQFPIDILI